MTIIIVGQAVGVAFTCAIFQRMMTFCAAGFGSDCVDCLLWSRCAAIACDCISHGSTGCCGIDCGRGCVLYVTVYIWRSTT